MSCLSRNRCFIVAGSLLLFVLVASILTNSYFRTRERRMVQVSNEIRAIAGAIEAYVAESNGRFPLDWDALVRSGHADWTDDTRSSLHISPTDFFSVSCTVHDPNVYTLPWGKELRPYVDSHDNADGHVSPPIIGISEGLDTSDSTLLPRVNTALRERLAESKRKGTGQ